MSPKPTNTASPFAQSKCRLMSCDTPLPWSCVIALWLGREAMETTLTYLHTHLELKESALAKLKPYKRAKAERFRPKTGFWNS